MFITSSDIFQREVNRKGKKMNKDQTVAEFVGNARHNALLLKQIIAAVYGTTEENIVINVQITAK